ncbi:hypothetical protein QA786_15040, partial [Listeria monocytogenes]|uniref:hypothetical protein n=1 Tax=Listeria monocytogenes TaxID=1639 RepID=UPI0024984A64
LDYILMQFIKNVNMDVITLIKIREKYWIDFELSELNFIHVSDQKFMNISNHHFGCWGLGIELMD